MYNVYVVIYRSRSNTWQTKCVHLVFLDSERSEEGTRLIRFAREQSFDIACKIFF